MKKLLKEVGCQKDKGTMIIIDNYKKPIRYNVMPSINDNWISEH